MTTTRESLEELMPLTDSEMKTITDGDFPFGPDVTAIADAQLRKCLAVTLDELQAVHGRLVQERWLGAAAALSIYLDRLHRAIIAVDNWPTGKKP